jgi:hypothetical protein
MAKRRTRRVPDTLNYPVLIVKPHNIEFKVDERVNCWIMRQMNMRIAEYAPIASKLPEFARNQGIHDFLNHRLHAKKSHLFFLDADTEPTDDYALRRLLMLDKDVVCGVTPVKIGTQATFVLGWNVQKKVGDKHENYDIDELPKEPFKIDRVGGTTLLIKRHVLEALAKEHKIFQKCSYNDNMTNIKLSEDYYFSELLTEAGFDIWCDPLTICRHYHYVDILDMMEVYRQARDK